MRVLFLDLKKGRLKVDVFDKMTILIFTTKPMYY